MKILNRTVTQQFASFYEEIISQIGEPQFCITQTPGRGEFIMEESTPVISLCTDLKRLNFEHQVAHELIHALRRKEGWPRIVGRPTNPVINELGITLGSIVLDLNVEDRLKAWSFDPIWILNEQYRNIRKAILDEDIPATGSNRWRQAVMMHCYALLTQPAQKWKRLRKLFTERSPHIEIKGEELSSILKKNDWNNPDEALASLIAIRDSIGINSNQVCIIDTRTENRF